MAMKKITALTNVGSAKWRMLAKGRSVTMDESEIDEGILRLWRSKAISIDGKMYETPKPDGVTEEAPKQPVVETRPQDTDGVDPDKKDEGSDGDVEENKDPDIDSEKSEDSEKEEEKEEEENKEEESGSESDKVESADTEEDAEKEESKEEISDEVLKYIESKPAGFFDRNKLDTLNSNELKQIGEKVGIEVKSRKKGVALISDKVERIMSA